MQPASNITLPPDWTDHGVEGLICQPATALDIIGFFVSNYIAHLFSLKWDPAETWKERAIGMAIALFYPASGLVCALESLHHKFRGCMVNGLRIKNELEEAHRAGALCMVVRSSEWVPGAEQVGQEIDFVRLKHDVKSREMGDEEVGIDSNPSTVDTRSDVEMPMLQKERKIVDGGQDSPPLETKRFAIYTPVWYQLADIPRSPKTLQQRKCDIHGTYFLPTGSEMAELPVTSVSSTSGWYNSLAGIYQICANSATLDRSQGDQINRYGYAALGLTVIPYLLMTAANFVCRLFTKDYPTLFVIRTPEMEEAILRGADFDGTVGSLEQLDKDALGDESSNSKNLAPLTLESVKNHGEQTIFSAVHNGNLLSLAASKNLGDHPHVLIPSCSPFACKNGDTGPHGLSATYSESTVSFRLLLFGSISLLAIEVFLYFNLSGFKSGPGSTNVQKGFTMAWVVLGSYYGGLAGLSAIVYNHISNTLFSMSGTVGFTERMISLLMLLLWFGAGLTPAIGGMVIVGLMIKDFGQCTRV